MKLTKSFGLAASSPLAEIVSGAAFRPRAGDVSAVLAERFAQKPLLLLMLARDRAATLRVSYSPQGVPKIGESRQVLRKEGGLASVLRAEALASGTTWVLVVLATGWQAELGLRSTRSGEASHDPFERYRLAAEHPDYFVPQPRAEYVYAPVDHPTLDRSIVFSFRRRELETVLLEVQAAGLEVAGVRLGIASLLERWMREEGEKALERDVLLTDGTSVLLLNAGGGDFGRTSLDEQDNRPALRQVSSRPNDVAQDLVRLVKDNDARPLVFLGPSELFEMLKESVGESLPEVRRPEREDLHDSVFASLSSAVLHDCVPSPRAERKPLPRRLRFWANATLLLSGAALLGGALFAWHACEAEARLSHSKERLAEIQSRRQSAERGRAEELSELTKAKQLRDWVLSGYHAQAFAHRLLNVMPPGVSLERIAAQLDEGSPQLSLEFSLLGGDEAQVSAARAIEREVLAMGCQIGERHQASSSSSVEHRWRLILPGEKGGRS